MYNLKIMCERRGQDTFDAMNVVESVKFMIMIMIMIMNMIQSIQNFVLMFLVDHNKHIIKNKHEQVQTMIEIMKIEHTNNHLGGTEHNNTASGLRF